MVCHHVDLYFGSACCLHFSQTTLKVKTAISPETCKAKQQSTQCHVSEYFNFLLLSSLWSMVFPLGYLEKRLINLENVIKVLIKFQKGRHKTKMINITDLTYRMKKLITPFKHTTRKRHIPDVLLG
jgi:hypothetical protein